MASDNVPNNIRPLLWERLDQQLQQRQARETGICPVREELYAQCFDELIRQVTINCAERWLLLLRVRDEMRMTMIERVGQQNAFIFVHVPKPKRQRQRRDPPIGWTEEYLLREHRTRGLGCCASVT